jgi:membrane protein implicated in regulation of membrane protease activity
MKMRNYLSRFGNKGFVLTLDLILAMVVVFTVLAVILFFVGRGSEVTLSEHQLTLIGSDIITLLDQKKSFDSFDSTEISIALTEIIPAQYEMLVRLQGDFTEGNGTIEVGGEIPSQRLITAGQRLAMSDTNTLFTITYFIWPRLQ